MSVLSPPPIVNKCLSCTLHATLVTNSECPTYDLGLEPASLGNFSKLTNLHSSPVAINAPPWFLSTPWICAPFTPEGYIPYTGQPNLTVHVAHVSSLNYVAPSGN